MTKSEQIREILLRRYPCAEIPRGGLLAVAREVGATNALVQRQAAKLGMASVRVAKEVRLCAGGCGTPVAVKDFCNSCTWVELPCEECGAPVRRRASDIAGRVGSTLHRQGRNKPAYTGRVFCNRECFGRWIGKGRKKDGTGEYPRGPESWHGTASGYSYHRCRCSACYEFMSTRRRALHARKKAAQA